MTSAIDAAPSDLASLAIGYWLFAKRAIRKALSWHSSVRPPAQPGDGFKTNKTMKSYHLTYSASVERCLACEAEGIGDGISACWMIAVME
jgi:hypothetical protein